MRATYGTTGRAAAAPQSEVAYFIPGSRIPRYEWFAHIGTAALITYPLSEYLSLHTSDILTSHTRPLPQAVCAAAA